MSIAIANCYIIFYPIKPDSTVVSYWDSLRDANGLHDIFTLQLCPPLGHSNSTGGGAQGGKMV